MRLLFSGTEPLATHSLLNRLIASASVASMVLLASASQPLRANDIQLPDIGDSSARVLPQQEGEKIGRSAFYQMRKHNYVLEDPESEFYMQSLGKRIARFTGTPVDDFRFFVVNDTRINAFAMPGGYIGTNIGLITEAETESELGGVTAHEITHVTQQHIARVIEATKGYDLATAALVIAAVLLGGGDGTVAQAAISAGLASTIERQINFTRSHEHEADRLGIRLLAQSGLDPDGMSAFFERLEQQSRYYQSNYPDFLRTHPVNNTRIAEARNRAEQYPDVKVESSLDFKLIRERLKVISAPDNSNPLTAYPAEPKDLAKRYGRALALQRAGQTSLAIKEFRALIEAKPEHLLFHLALADALVQERDASQSRKVFDDAALLFGDHPVLLWRRAEAMTKIATPDEARRSLYRALRAWPDSPAMHQALARNAADLERQLEVHLHVADYHFFRASMREAEDQLDIAMRMPGISDVDRQRIKAKRAWLRANDPQRKN